MCYLLLQNSCRTSNPAKDLNPIKKERSKLTIKNASLVNTNLRLDTSGYETEYS